jgi:hypothetical protein
LGTDEANESVFSTFFDATDPQETNHLGSFEAVVLNTKVYSNAVNGLLRKDTNTEFCDQASTVADIVSSEGMAIRTGRPFLDPTPLPPTVEFAMRELGVHETVAVSMVGCTAVGEEELSFEHSTQIRSVQKIDNLWYLGQIHDSIGVELVGRFRRDQVYLQFCLSNPIVTETNDAIFAFNDHEQFSLSKRQKLKVQVCFNSLLCVPRLTIYQSSVSHMILGANA